MKSTLCRVVAVMLATLMYCGTCAAASDRFVALVSDLHVGAGKKPDGKWREIEDFRWQADFDQFLDSISTQGKGKTDLVLAGDVFEMWQSPTMQCSGDLSDPKCSVADCVNADKNLGCSETEAIARLDYVLKQHPDFIASILKFVAAGSNRVYFVPGNHDAALLLPGVQALLLGHFKDARVAVEARGYWLSGDGRIYADHGHQFDDVNMFSDWPVPFIEKNGVRYLRKTWGENMVQEFYNQYEVIFPIIDNLSDEKKGAGYAIKQAGFANSASAVGKFLKYIVLQESLLQASSLLEPGRGIPQWNYAAIRGQPALSVDDILEKDPAMLAAVQRAGDTTPVALDPAQLTDDEAELICTAKYYIKSTQLCPVLPGVNLNAALKSTQSRETRTREYLKKVLPKVARPGGPYASVYVSGHTHAAVVPEELRLGDFPTGNVVVSFVNTGAFQRVASPEQIAAILALAPGGAKVPLDLQLENLPGCYNYVWIPPYRLKPTATLMQWAEKQNGAFQAKEAVCIPLV